MSGRGALTKESEALLRLLADEDWEVQSPEEMRKRLAAIEAADRLRQGVLGLSS